MLSNENYVNRIFAYFERSLMYINNMATIFSKSFPEMLPTFCNNVSLTLQTIYCSTSEYILYLLYLQTFNEFVIRLIVKLSQVNMLYTKLFQWVYLDSFFTDEGIKKTFQSFTDYVKVDEEEIDYLIIRNLLTKEPGLHFTSMKPFHAGTVSITFQARLHRKPVIIKILRKGIHEKLAASVHFLLFIAKLLSYIPYTCEFQLYDIMIENIDSLISQSDLRIEGQNTKKFHQCLSNHEHLYCPSVHYVSKEVLIQEYVYGSNIYELENLEENKRKVICASVYEFIFQSMCDLGTFHGDMHPGNLLFIVHDDDYTINFIDYGITYEVEEERRMKIMKIIWMLTEVDDTDFFNYLYDHGTKETSHEKTNIASKSVVVAELVELRKKYDMFRNTIKPVDVYHTNKVLRKYNLRTHPEFSRAFMFLYSMCSLMCMLQSIDMTLYQKCLKVYFAMNHEKLKHLL